MAKLPAVANIKSKSKKRPLEDVQEESVKKATGAGHWSSGLISAMSDPNLKVSDDDQVVVIKDKYPKATIHYLILPKEDISSLGKVTKKHLDLLKHMSKVGTELAEQHSDHKFKIGYHAQASMSRLHLHVISDDLLSPCLKTKKHWNSFASAFFVPHTEVIESLEKSKNSQVSLMKASERKRLLELPLKCHKCEFEAGTIPKLKNHLTIHEPKVKTGNTK